LPVVLPRAKGAPPMLTPVTAYGEPALTRVTDAAPTALAHPG
jgi:hypothetical protein